MATKDESAAGKALEAAAAPGGFWSNNNTACTNTWFCLSKDILGQLPTAASKDFDKAAEVTIEELAFWNKDASATRSAEAKALATTLTNLFVNMVGAEYEDGQNFASAVIAMHAILSNGSKTVCDLAAVVDQTHKFLNEQA